MTAARDALFAWARHHLEELQQAVSLMEAGKAHTSESSGHAMLDTTNKSIARAKQHIAELQQILGRDETRATGNGGTDPDGHLVGNG